MCISAEKIQILILDFLKESSEKNPMPCSELARKIAFKEGMINDEYVSDACLDARFRDTFQNVLQSLISHQRVQFVSSSGPKPWAGYVYLQ